jgi:hypothetical protein
VGVKGRCFVSLVSEWFVGLSIGSAMIFSVLGVITLTTFLVVMVVWVSTFLVAGQLREQQLASTLVVDIAICSLATLIIVGLTIVSEALYLPAIAAAFSVVAWFFGKSVESEGALAP